MRTNQHMALAVYCAAALLAGLLSCAATLAAPPRDADRARSIQAFQTYVYPYLRSRCASCHSTQQPLIASEDVNQAYRATKQNLDAALERSSLVAKARDGHCGPGCRGDGSELLAALKKWTEHEASGAR